MYNVYFIRCVFKNLFLHFNTTTKNLISKISFVSMNSKLWRYHSTQNKHTKYKKNLRHAFSYNYFHLMPCSRLKPLNLYFNNRLSLYWLKLKKLWSTNINIYNNFIINREKSVMWNLSPPRVVDFPNQYSCQTRGVIWTHHRIEDSYIHHSKYSMVCSQFITVNTLCCG